jgi:hypothetical protein
VNAVHEDVRFTGTMAADVNEEITSLASWRGLTVRRWAGAAAGQPRTAPPRAYSALSSPHSNAAAPA